MTILRVLIEAMWRHHNGHGEEAELVASEHEWQFYEKLLVTSPSSVIEHVKRVPPRPILVSGESGSPTLIDSIPGM